MYESVKQPDFNDFFEILFLQLILTLFWSRTLRTMLDVSLLIFDIILSGTLPTTAGELDGLLSCWRTWAYKQNAAKG